MIELFFAYAGTLFRRRCITCRKFLADCCDPRGELCPLGVADLQAANAIRQDLIPLAGNAS